MSLEIKQNLCQNLEYSLEGLYELIKQFHNPNLIKEEEQPNDNIIYHIYNDGEITHQKGGWAYRQRTEFIEQSPIRIRKFDFSKFPIQTKNLYDQNIGYIIATKEDCITIRKYMDKLI